MTVQLTINGQSIEAQAGLSLFDHAELLGIDVPTSCRKQGKCKECMVEVVEGMDALSAVTEPEGHLKGKFRLSCQTTVAAAHGEVRCQTMRRGHMRIERQALGLPGNYKALQLDPAVTRDGDRILIDGVEVDRSTGPIHGIAMDLGTTTVVLRLIDLESGELIADTSFENPQRFGGSEVMSRIAYDTDHPGRLLMRTLAGYLSHAIEAFPVDPNSIYEIPKARVYGAPIISGHVGADAAAAMLAVDLAHEERLIAVMDIGTNTELILGNRHRILAASCPAGPAFEGGAIACGMPALDGAIESFAIGGEGQFLLGVIGDVAPQGICGSGLVDVMSELLRTGAMNERGRFEDDVHRINLYRNQTRDVFLLESDVNELAQAKGANVAGLHVVFSSYGIDFDELDVFYLAGGFGRNLNVESSRRIGLIPSLPPSRIVQAGNIAIEGATIALLSKTKRQELEELVKKVEHCRLETHPAFFDFFVEGCQFKPVEPMPCAN